MMLPHLTAYLLHYKQVGIPHVGSLRLLHQPPVLNVADKLMEPPSYTVEINEAGNISEHQLNFLDGATGKHREAVEEELQFFGTVLKQKMDSGGFDWEGLGTIRNGSKNTAVVIPALQAVPAEKVLRQDVAHKVLVGDKEVHTVISTADEKEAVIAHKSGPAFLVTGWVILLLSLFAIGFVLYTGNFTVNAAGSRLSPKTWIKINEGTTEP